MNESLSYIMTIYFVLDSLKLNTPVVQMATGMDDNFMAEPGEERHALDDIDDAIAIATAGLGLMPGAAFQARVSQLAQLNIVHKTV
jgi:dynein heavy chain